MSAALHPADAAATAVSWLDSSFALTTFKDYAAATKHEEPWTLRTLAERILVTTAHTKAALPWLKLARFGGKKTPLVKQPDGRTTGGSLRHDANVLAITGIEADYDGEKMTVAEAVEKLEKAGILAMVYTSPSHTEAAPRWRVICPTSCELPPDQREKLMGRLNGLFGGVFSGESWTLSQSYYYGSVNHNPAHRVELIDGTPIDLHDDLDEIWTGKPNTSTTTKANGERVAGPLDEAALLAEITSGASYHEPTVRLLGRWALQGVPMLEARQRLLGAFDAVFPPDRDARWHARRDDVDRCLEHIYGKEAQQKDDGKRPTEPPPPSGEDAYGTATRTMPEEDTSASRARTKAAATESLIAARLDPTPIGKIPPRQWAYGRFLLFGSAAVLGAVDGGGKGAIAVAILLATITGQPLLGEHVWRTGPVAIVSYEDDEIEWRRRIAAACIHYGLDYAEVLANVRFISRPGGRVTFAAHSDAGVIFPDSAEIIACLTELRAALLIVDPFNHAHSLEDGNSNALMARVAGEMTRIAHVTGAAVLVLHHLRKGANGNPDDLMGATSLRATFRSCRILARMAPEMAEKMNIADPWRYIRVAGSKENYAPPPERGTWYRLIGIPLGNATDSYPEGDNVAVATTWQPRPLFDGMDGTTLAAVFGALREGQWGPAKQARHIPWAGNVLIETGHRSEREATKIVTGWLENGVLVKGSYYHAASKNNVGIVTVDEAKVADILAANRDIDGPPE